MAISRRGFLQGTAALVGASSIVAAARGLQNKKTLAYVGTSTGAVGNGSNGRGIYLFEMNPMTGALSLIKLAAESRSPSWLEFHPSGKYLYAANEVADFDGNNGSVSAFAVDRSSGDRDS